MTNRRSHFDVAAAEQVLINGTSHRPMDHALGLGVVSQQVALIVGQFVHSARPASPSPDLSR